MLLDASIVQLWHHFTVQSGLLVAHKKCVCFKVTQTTLLNARQDRCRADLDRRRTGYHSQTYKPMELFLHLRADSNSLVPIGWCN